jgi:CRP-like cAMP-binding protein
MEEMSDPLKAAQVLQRVAWIAALGPTAVDELSTYAVRKGARKGQVVVRAGHGGELIIVASGLLETALLNDPTMMPAKPKRFGAGDVVGMALLDGHRHELDVVAVESSSLLILPVDVVRERLITRPHETIRAMATLSQTRGRVITTSGEHNPELERRLVDLLIELSHGQRAVTSTRGELAKKLGVSRDDVIRQLERMEEAGQVLVRRGRIELISLSRR